MPLLKKDQVDSILKNAPEGADKRKILDGLITRGYDIEGVDSVAIRQKLAAPVPQTTEKEPTFGQELKSDLDKRVNRVGEILDRKDSNVAEKGLQVFGQGAGLAANAIEKTIEQIPGAKFVFDKIGDGINWLTTSDLSPVKAIGEKIGDSKALQEIVQLYDTDQNFKDSLDGFTNIIRLGGDVQGVASSANFAKNVTSKIVSKVEGATQAAIEANAGSVNAVKTTIEDFGRKIKAAAEPDVDQAVKTSLNPAKALAGTGQDIEVSVNGKLKKLSELTPEEEFKVQESTARSVEKFTEQAKKFANDRSVEGGSPVEIVGQRVDNVLESLNKRRQAVGREMGDIEAKYTGDKLPLSTKTSETFAETLKNFDNPKFGADTADANIVRKLVSDFDNLEKAGATIGERLEFVRSWDKYLNDARDGFGNFKENATVNTRIQNAVKVLKDETVDAISAKDKVYRKLRSQYRTYKVLDEIGDALLGKEGALGDRVKGAATVKRAIQSNSDAGARQFLKKLKELTGYDAIKEGDLALTAMENVGDYQGLSLLNIVTEGKSGLIRRALEFAEEKILGTKEERVKRYIQK